MTTTAAIHSLRNRPISAAYLRLALDQLVGDNPARREEVLAAAGLRDSERAGGQRGEVEFGILATAMTAMTAGRARGWHLELLARLDAAVHGPLGFALLAAPTPGQALETLVAYGELRLPFVWFASSVDESMGRIDCTPSGDLGSLRAPLMELTVLALSRFVAQVSGRPARLVSIQMPGDPPPYEQALRASVDASIDFGSAGYAVVFPSSWLCVTSLFADEDMHRLSVARCRDLLGVGLRRSPLELSLRQEILAAGGVSPGLEALARSRHMSSRTLMRRLKRQGTSYRRIVEEIHAGLAADLLRHTELPIAEIAARLGFADTANFGRAFRGWHAVAPGRYRRGQADDPSRDDS